MWTLILSRYSSKYRIASINIHNVLLLFTGVISHWLYRIWAVSQSQDAMDHTLKLKSSSPWVSALVLRIDFWRIKQWPPTTKTASSPVENVAYVFKPKQCTGLWNLFHWRFCFHKYKLTKLSCDTTYCSIHKSTKVVAFHLLRQQICLDMNKILLLSF